MRGTTKTNIIIIILGQLVQRTLCAKEGKKGKGVNWPLGANFERSTNRNKKNTPAAVAKANFGKLRSHERSMVLVQNKIKEISDSTAVGVGYVPHGEYGEKTAHRLKQEQIIIALAADSFGETQRHNSEGERAKRANFEEDEKHIREPQLN